MKKKSLILFCSALMLTGALTGCGKNIDDASQIPIGTNGQQIVNLMYGVQAMNSESSSTVSPEATAAATDFGLRLLSGSMEEGKNTLVSPLSVLMALGMTANGADNETLEQMEEVFGMTHSELNQYLYAYTAKLPQGEKYKLTLADSIWIKDSAGLQISKDFLQANADWYDAQIYQAPFIDATKKEINNWVKRNTDGMIPEILDRIASENIMYLINALAFDAEWEQIYKTDQIHDGIFTTADGTEQKVKMMYSGESLYLEDEDASGFVKYYAGDSYAFAALLPKEGVNLADYVSSLTGERINELLSNPQETSVNAAIPKFQCQYSVELSDILKAMGMTDAFDSDSADFSLMLATESSDAGMAEPIYIDRVLHKTYITLDEKGTRAGAATAVAMSGGAALEEKKVVHLDRPFIYMLIDCEENLPVFIGTLERVK